jgi:hypothetical protein
VDVDTFFRNVLWVRFGKGRKRPASLVAAEVARTVAPLLAKSVGRVDENITISLMISNVLRRVTGRAGGAITRLVLFQ